MTMIVRPIAILLLLTHLAGCASTGSRGERVVERSDSSPLLQASVPETTDAVQRAADATERVVSLTAYQETGPLDDVSAPIDSEDSTTLIPDVPNDPGATDADTQLSIKNYTSNLATDTTIDFSDVINSVHQSYPLVEAAYQEQALTAGNQISAWGAFDTKLKAASESGPLGFYETYRNSAGFETPIYGGGEFFGGYRNGGGDFQPWYQERETNDGGEFKGGFRVPLIRDRDIDSRRADLWRATYDQQLANPFIRGSLIEFSREAGLSYWKWVATSRKYGLGQQWLALAEGRNEGIQKRVKAGDLAPPEEIDNERAIAKREAKLADSLRELKQAAAKLSIFLRDDAGTPFVPSVQQTAFFPPLLNIDSESLNTDILTAQQNRPELQALDLQVRKLRVDYSEAVNMTRPGLDAQIVGSQDVGQPTSKKRDKSEFELEAALFFDVPIQRRKGLGKMQAVQAKITMTMAKRRVVQDKVAAEVQAAYAGLIESRNAALKARQAVQLATQMAEIERNMFEKGASDLLKVALREQYALEAAEEEISAMYSHFAAFTAYAAAVADERPSVDSL